ncbi:zinc-ribbon domain-containing protein [Limosilactobacillus fastidiosus]|uniref:Zinc-ribbon domain-containing protein n=1 Tax=Limosilactobacillus fastidiosus TaxID=2759855 RepID=A0A7W3TZI9_9LACO|nr:zinc-ribbon domain-containing protein [Limosilactobacillus fastidiosus]MBB1063114.1 zinc-ribbon domain-containing protein [Limosilactobacillus fastidiosus]MBB1086183.1 zinc-ribbon domain-containing protein [Limosilactobacillus fastidiosus]MCD7084129.1 zinc-ribbon domain-containing protein [Limosilactobacillus fastidiosus]MCD7086488.1 zinc-ribbon domain-containing protein [Limosilactobacillus fastidiosus]MCD7114642.1 zinc-ribbon domain-containing protein [Limosilactobacillus fastidiosus]
MKKCPWCGKKVPNEEQICPSCGYDFSRGEMSSFYDQRQQKQIKSKIRHKNEMVIVAALAIIAGGSYIFNNHQEQTEAQQNIQQTTKTIAESSSSDAEPSNNSSKSSVKKSSGLKKTENKKTIKNSQSKKDNANVTKESNGVQLKASMAPNELAAAVATYAAQKNISKWRDVVNNSGESILIRETTEPDIVNYLSAKGSGTVYVAFNSKDSNREVVYSAYTINQDGSINIYEFGVPNAPHTGNVYNPVETISQQDLIKYLNSHKQAKNVRQMAQKVGISYE